MPKATEQENRDCYIRVRVTQREKIALDNRCRMKKTTVSEVLRNLVEEFVKQPIISFDSEN